MADWLDAVNWNADGLVPAIAQEAATGAVLTQAWMNREALERTYQATPEPRWVVAVGDCARDGGVFAGSYACAGGVSAVLPVDLHIPGCPPSPTVLLRGLLALVEAVSGEGS